MFWIMKFILFIPFSILFPCSFKGRKNLPKGKCIVICNHLSNIDYMYLFNRIWRKQFVLAKEQCFKNGFINWFFRSCGGIPVNRDEIKISTIKECLKVLKKDKLLTIFPEGTRNKSSEPLLDFKAGASSIAIKANAPIVPIYIQKKPGFFKFNRIVVGKPIILDSTYKGEEGTKKANQLLKDKMLELKK